MSLLLLATLATPALAARPDEGGGFASFEDSDVLDFVDGPAGIVRVHYSVSGPSVTVLDDDDGSGKPDYPELVAATAETVLVLFEDLGFRPPVAEAALGLDHLGGSGAFDFYLVDFGGSADGQFAVDDCGGGQCVGHMLMENDFQGYGYSSLAQATDVLTSHELFHAVQAAYDARLPVWLSEGMAVWAEKRFDDHSRDFFWLCSAYLEEPTRPIDSPPAGTVTAWAYGTGLFIEYVTVELGLEAGPALLEATESHTEDEALQAIVDTLEDGGLPLAEAWPRFARWNLGTGPRAGAMEGWDFGDALGQVPMEVNAEGLLEDDNRFYPVATTYWSFLHEGGPVAFAAEDDPVGLAFSIHPATATNPRAPAGDAVREFWPEGTAPIDLGELDAGLYYVVGSYPERAPESTKVHFCIGAPAAVAACAPVDTPEPDDTGAPDDDTGTAPDDADPGADGATDATESGDKDGCATVGGGAGWLALFGLVGLARRRR